MHYYGVDIKYIFPLVCLTRKSLTETTNKYEIIPKPMLKYCIINLANISAPHPEENRLILSILRLAN